MELKEAIEKLNELLSWRNNGLVEIRDYEFEAIDKVLEELNNLQKEKEEYRIGWCNEGEKCEKLLEELNNRISKDDLKNILRKVQDYQLNYKDTVLFNIIMQEIFGETEWTNLENKE